MDQPYIGAIYAFAGNFAILNYAQCVGQLMSISENQTLYTLIGTTYGGDGQNTFGLPDLRGRLPLHQGTGNGLSTYVMGQIAGTENVTLTNNSMPSHTHLVNGNNTGGATSTGTATSYLATVSASETQNLYTNGVTPNATLASATIGNSGSNIPFSIIQPVLTITYLMALFGVFPSRN
jgi:microcystin-dependent protein